MGRNSPRIALMLQKRALPIKAILAQDPGLAGGLFMVKIRESMGFRGFSGNAPGRGPGPWKVRGNDPSGGIPGTLSVKGSSKYEWGYFGARRMLAGLGAYNRVGP